MPQGAPAHRQRGFNLVELIVTVTIMAILLVIAVPSFRSLLNSNRLTAPANELVAGLQLARSEAIRRNARTVVCRSDNVASGAAADCTAGTSKWPGWIAFVDTDRNGAHAVGETLLRSGTVDITTPLEILPSVALSGETNRVIFRADGLARTAAANTPLSAIVSMCMPTTTQRAENIREVRLVAGSRLSVTRMTVAGACAAPPNTR